jgi:hypothetical protein
MPEVQPKRCSWVNVDHELMREYHDREWGVPRIRRRNWSSASQVGRWPHLTIPRREIVEDERQQRAIRAVADADLPTAFYRARLDRNLARSQLRR